LSARRSALTARAIIEQLSLHDAAEILGVSQEPLVG
jgi:hypothetical protein